MTQQATASFESFLEEVQSEHDQIQSELREISVLVNQITAEVERLAQRNAQILAYVRQLNIETAPREDIRDGYEDLINTQQRLFTMRAQLEKLQSDKRNMARLIELQEHILQLSGRGGFAEAEDGQQKAIDRSGVVRVIQSEEFARQSLVRRMHDGPASSLSNFILQAEICERLFDNDPDKARHELHTLKEDATATFSKVKDFIFDLRPMMLDDLGVVPTLRSYANSFQDKTGVPLVMSVTGIERRLESYIEVTIFRAVQELVNNARIHGQATEIQFQLDISSEEVTVVVEDNGQGFDAREFLEKSPDRKTVGLPALRERLEMLNGTLKIESQVSQGTKAEFKIPLDNGIE